MKHGCGFLEIEYHETHAAIAELDGKSFEGKVIIVKFEQKQRNRHHWNNQNVIIFKITQ
jgi:RNA recognition motif-containing protein